MANVNKVMLIGRLTRDVELRTTPSGSSVADMGLAINRRYKTSSGESKEDACFVDCTLWGKTADLAQQFLRKGSQVFVEGRLTMDSWEKDGKKVSKIKVTAENIQFLDGATRPSDQPVAGADMETPF